MKEKILNMMKGAGGIASLYFKNLETGESFGFNEHFAHNAASVIKLPVMVEAMRQFESGEARADELLTLRDEDRVPGCGVIAFMHSGLELSLMDLIWVMITVSDNMATNMLIERLGIQKIEATIRALGLNDTTLKRKLFEKREGLSELVNRVSAYDMGVLLEGIYRGEVVSKDASRKMIDVLLGQQLGKKIPFLLPEYEVAHKTGEQTDTTHDVGIVYARQPFVVCFCGSEVNAPEMNALYARIALELANYCGGAPIR